MVTTVAINIEFPFENHSVIIYCLLGLCDYIIAMQ